MVQVRSRGRSLLRRIRRIEAAARADRDPLPAAAARRAPRAACGSPGLELLWIKESFRYKLLGEQGDRDAAGSLHPGLVLVAGAQRNRSPKLRLEGYASIVSAKKKVTRGETYEPSNAEKVNAGSLGLRIYWRLP